MPLAMRPSRVPVMLKVRLPAWDALAVPSSHGRPIRRTDAPLVWTFGDASGTVVRPWRITRQTLALAQPTGHAASPGDRLLLVGNLDTASCIYVCRWASTWTSKVIAT